MTESELYGLAWRRVRECYALAEARYCKRFQLPTLALDLKGTRVLGNANQDTHHIRLNLEVFARNVERYLVDTIPHECAHLIAPAVYSFLGRGHGRGWKAVACALGADPVACDTRGGYNLEGLKVRRVERFAYTCPCGIDHQLTKHRAATVWRRVCKRCKGKLFPVDRSSAETDHSSAPA